MSGAGPLIGKEDDFEDRYTAKFKTVLSGEGLFIQYDRDRAALDVGLHLTDPVAEQRRVSQARIWFQLEGIHATTLSSDTYACERFGRLPISLEQLKLWFASPEPVYLALYVEAADHFLVEDVREIVYRQWGEQFLSPSTFPFGQKEVTVKMRIDALLTVERIGQMLRHQSMRVDGPLFRGRSLGHRLDPLRCTPERLEPATYVRLVQRLLAVHDYRPIELLEPAANLLRDDIPLEHVILSVGRLYNTFEWVPQLFSEVGVGPDDDFRIEGAPQFAHGPTAVLIDGEGRVAPDAALLKRFAQTIDANGVRRILVFANTDELEYVGRFRGVLRNSGVECMPQLLGDLAFSLLTATAVYLEFREAISWRTVNYLWSPTPSSAGLDRMS